MVSADEIVTRAGCAAFSCGPDTKITVWNAEAEKLFAAWASTTVGEPCHRVVGGLDPFGNVYCTECCACWAMARVNRPIRPFRLSVIDGLNHRFDVQMMILRVEAASGVELVHLMEPANGDDAPALFHHGLSACQGVRGEV